MAEQKKSQLVIIFLTVFIYLVGFGIIIPIIPVLGRDFGASSLQVGLLMSVFSLFQFIFAPFWGRLSDRVGRRPVLLFCLVGETLSYLFFAWTSSLEGLFVARALGGFFGASISTSSAYISDITAKDQRSRGMALIGAAFGLGFIIGPALGGGLTVWYHHLAWDPKYLHSFIGLSVALLCLATGIFAFFKLPESLNLKEGLQLKQKISRWVRFLSHLSRKTLGVLVVVYFLGIMSMAMMESTLILFVGDRFNWGIKEVSFGFATIGVFSALTHGVFVRRLLPKFGERKILAAGLLIFAFGLCLIGFSSQIELLALAMIAVAVGNGFINPATLGSISLLSESHEQGEIMGTAQSFASLGRIIGPAVGGLVYGRVGITSPFLLGAAVVIVGMILVLVNWKQLPNLAQTEKPIGA